MKSNMNELKNHGKKWVYWFLLGLALIVVYKFLDQFNNVADAVNKFFNAAAPIIAGIFIAYILYLPSRKIEQFFKKSKTKFLKNHSRGLSIILVYILLILICTILLKSILPIVVDSAKELISNLQGYIQVALEKYREVPENSILKSQVISQFVHQISNIDLTQYINLENITEYAKGAIELITGIFNAFVAFIVSVYVLLERDSICNFIKRATKAMIKTNRYKVLAKYVNNANEIFSGFIASQLIDAIIMSILSIIVLSIMGIKYAPLLGTIIGLFNVIPYVGAIIGIGLAALITLITGGLTPAVWLLIIITILQQIDANVINPSIIGNSLKISPLLVIVAVTIGGTYWGMGGMFIAVPICALIKIIAEDYIDFKTKRKER